MKMKLSRPISIAILIFVIILFSIISLSSLIPKYDEVTYHLPTLKLFYDTDCITASLSSNYIADNTPFPYILINSICKLLNVEPNLFIARFTGIFMMLLTLFFARRYFLRLEIKGEIIFLFYLLFYPYFIKPAFSFYMSVYGLLFFILTLYFLKQKSLKSIFFAGIFNAIAILCQQFYLVILIWFLFQQIIEYKNGIQSHFLIKRILTFALPSIAPLLLFIGWGGLTHQNFHRHYISFSIINMTNLTAILAIFGGLLFPLFFEKIKYFKLTSLGLISAMALFLKIFTSPQWHIVGGKGLIAGYTYHVLNILDQYLPTIGFIVEFLLIFCGLSILFFLYSERKANPDIANDSILLFFLILGFLPYLILSERHMLHLVFLGFILAFFHIKNQITRFVFLIYQILIGSVYYYYWILIKTVANI